MGKQQGWTFHRCENGQWTRGEYPHRQQAKEPGTVSVRQQQWGAHGPGDTSEGERVQSPCRAAWRALTELRMGTAHQQAAPQRSPSLETPRRAQEARHMTLCVCFCLQELPEPARLIHTSKVRTVRGWSDWEGHKRFRSDETPFITIKVWATWLYVLVKAHWASHLICVHTGVCKFHLRDKDYGWYVSHLTLPRGITCFTYLANCNLQMIHSKFQVTLHIQMETYYSKFNPRYGKYLKIRLPTTSLFTLY